MIKSETKISVDTGEVIAIGIEDVDRDSVALKFWTHGGATEYVLPRKHADLFARHMLGIEKGLLL